MPEKLYFDGMHGIGDNINQRCFVKALVEKGHEVWLKTPLPEIYVDIPNVHFVHSNSPLRTQQKSEQHSLVQFEPEPPGIPRSRIFYGNGHLQQGSIFAAMEQQFGTRPARLDLPRYKPAGIRTPDGKPVAVIRPTTERTEWHNASRGPLNQYIDDVSRQLAIRGFHVISVADVQEGKEWIPDGEPFAHQKFHNGEINIWQMLALVESADIVLTGPCVIMHAALAYERPMICLGGGNGGNNHHLKVTDPRCMDLSRALFVYPDNYCCCQEMIHDCDKVISRLQEKVHGFIENTYNAARSRRAA
ncbi:glycosyltransferase family 9 protein [Citrobacter freundii]|uniref:glycosyltransferase family 9 protein n=1 Tax=Citrobacter freundii TaxID=546 RepID=UPI001EEFDEE6|nr:glycosyltransferase family 9 protein [Citrobacter freundii]